jgi:hypothetical protein
VKLLKLIQVKIEKETGEDNQGISLKKKKKPIS